ncbi:hypothetical protein SAY87_027587 [Trapa incisa]|uniref:Uncharacterized protein n=1 Tax=Trapa incisa TaxID=236973 RepID=A0AAN7PKB2_9MYRT|nr:hypothetical protein SAY87_027587 [Trapa incisa]
MESVEAMKAMASDKLAELWTVDPKGSERDTTGLTAANTELQLQLQAIEQQARLCDVFRLSKVIMIIKDHCMPKAAILHLISCMLQVSCEELSWLEVPAHLPRRALLGAGQNVTGNNTGASILGLVKLDIVIMVIYTVAFFFIILCPLGIRLIIRHARRYDQRFPFESQEGFATRLASIDLQKGDIERIPSAIYGAVEAIIRGTDCSICLWEFVQGDMVRVLPKCCHSVYRILAAVPLIMLQL